jgi:hypothetical protein
MGDPCCQLSWRNQPANAKTGLGFRTCHKKWAPIIRRLYECRALEAYASPPGGRRSRDLRAMHPPGDGKF